MARKVLIADDSSSIRMMLRSVLVDAGYDVADVADGSLAVGEADQFCPELVITDLNMPNMDGVELIKALRSKASFRFIPILVLSTEGQQEKIQRGREAGATGWLIKPFQPEKLLAVVRKVLPDRI
ncbi:MAG: hypothetical protein ACD_39C01840G0001 [uncultured bacterium]|nr:MAG: hypothetical protein ACD_39C01840G0001 [uncultured bacterium]